MGIIIGILFALVGVFNLIRYTMRLKKCTEKVEATVVGFEVRSNGGELNRNMYYPIYEYKVNGESKKVVSKFGKTGKMFEKNEKVELRYNPDNITEYCVPADKTAYAISYGFIAGGIAFALVMCLWGNK